LSSKKLHSMKKAMFILSTVLLFGILSSCSSSDDVTVKKNWTFTINTVTVMSGISVPVVTTENKDNLTEVEAEAARLALETELKTEAQTQVQQAQALGMTISMTVTVTKAERK